MKNFYKLPLLFFSLIIFSCSTEESLSDEESLSAMQVASKVTIEGNGTIINSSYVDTKENAILVGVEIINKKTKQSLPIFYHKLLSDDNEPITQDTDPNSFNGIYTIEFDGEIIRKSVVKNGNVISTEKFNETNLAQKYPCTASGMVTCADDKFNNMNVISYMFCVAGAPACLAEAYASCMYDYC